MFIEKYHACFMHDTVWYMHGTTDHDLRAQQGMHDYASIMPGNLHAHA